MEDPQLGWASEAFQPGATASNVQARQRVQSSQRSSCVPRRGSATSLETSLSSCSLFSPQMRSNRTENSNLPRCRQPQPPAYYIDVLSFLSCYARHSQERNCGDTACRSQTKDRGDKLGEILREIFLLFLASSLAAQNDTRIFPNSMQSITQSSVAQK